MGLAFLGIGARPRHPRPHYRRYDHLRRVCRRQVLPLSDTTNLAAAVAETGLFDHVTAMVSTTGPTLLLSLILYTILGLNVDTSAYDATVAEGIQEAFRGAFTISPILLLPIIVVIVMCILRVPGLVGIAISVATAVVFMLIFQSTDIFYSYSLGDIFDVLHYGHAVETGNAVADSILGKAKGMDGMMWTINLILVALAYGGAPRALRLHREALRRPQAQDPLRWQPDPRHPADLHLLRRHHVRSVPRHWRSRPHLC
ncbi:MAG: Na+/H+ antiporter NhaC family protein [Oscillospiraceae bacterium]